VQDSTTIMRQCMAQMRQLIHMREEAESISGVEDPQEATEARGVVPRTLTFTVPGTSKLVSATECKRALNECVPSGKHLTQLPARVAFADSVH
jgi:hypothetical protein